MKLKLGKMTTKQLAQWMNIGYGSFRNNKDRYLKRLSDFCQFEPIYGGVMITEIYDEEYDKCAPQDKQIFLKEIYEANEGLSSVAGVSRKVQFENEYYAKMDEGKIERKFRKVNKGLFGDFGKGQDKVKEAKGKCGSRKWVYAIKIDDYNHYRTLTKEQQDVFRHIVKSVYGNETEKIMESMLLEEAFKETDMSKEEYLLKRERFDLDLFPQMLKQFRKQTGLVITRVQNYKLNEQGLKLVSAF